MLDLVSYKAKQNKFVLKCWALIALVLTVAYMCEFIKGARDMEYIFIFLIMTWVPVVVNIILLYYMGVSSESLKFPIVIGYSVFYCFVMFTTVTHMSFVFIVPMISVLVVYNDEKVVSNAYNCAIGINIAYIVTKLYMGYHSSEDIIAYEIQLACLVLSKIYLKGSSRSLRFSYDNMLRLSTEVELDELTGLYNRHMLRQKSEEYFKGYKKGLSISIAVIDIDKFKQFNDNYGHKFGDLVLKRVSKVIKNEVKDLQDIHAYRTGGDEFLIMGKCISNEELYKICKEVCNKISNLELMYNDTKVSVQVSIGVANTISDNCDSYDDLYTEADANLYVAKNNGRNTVCCGDNSKVNVVED